MTSGNSTVKCDIVRLEGRRKILKNSFGIGQKLSEFSKLLLATPNNAGHPYSILTIAPDFFHTKRAQRLKTV